MGRKSPTLRRIVTGHHERGRAVLRSVEQLQPEVIPSGDAARTLGFVHDRDLPSLVRRTLGHAIAESVQPE